MTPAILRAAVTTALLNHTDAEGRIYPTRMDSISGDSLRKKGPVLCIYSMKRKEQSQGGCYYKHTEMIVVEGLASGSTDVEAGDNADLLEGQVRDLLLSDSAWLPICDDGTPVVLGDEIDSDFGPDGSGDRVLTFALILPLSYGVTYVSATAAEMARDLDFTDTPPEGAGHETKATIQLSEEPS